MTRSREAAPHRTDAESKVRSIGCLRPRQSTPLYDYLFSKEVPGEQEGSDPADDLNPNSLEVLTGCKLEPGLAEAKVGTGYQFMRQGYFCVDSVDSKPGALVFNRTVGLRDSWAKISGKKK